MNADPFDDVVTIRPMRVDDIDALMPFERDMFGTEAWTRNGYRSELADARHRHYVTATTVTATSATAIATDGDAIDGDALLGWAGVMVIGPTAEILTVGVVPAARRHGIARRLVATLLDEARRRGAAEVFLEVRIDNDAARALYRSGGFVELGLRRGYYAGGRVDAVTMRLELAP